MRIHANKPARGDILRRMATSPALTPWPPLPTTGRGGTGELATQGTPLPVVGRGAGGEGRSHARTRCEPSSPSHPLLPRLGETQAPPQGGPQATPQARPQAVPQAKNKQFRAWIDLFEIL